MTTFVRIGWLVLVMMVITAALAACVSQPVGKALTSPDRTIDPAALERHVRMLSETLHPRSYEHAANLDAAADYVLAQFKGVGARTEVQTYDVGGRTYRNIIARFGPETGALLVIGAHYDSCGDTPGADDNASGVAGRRQPKDAAVLGITASDLWPGDGWNFVFGQASLKERVGVWSMARNGEADASLDERWLCALRTTMTATHETGHMFGIRHCIAYECGMNGSNNSDERDRQPLEFCPECQPKLWWTLGLDPVTQPRPGSRGTQTWIPGGGEWFRSADRRPRRLN